jgi:16S rRNA (adenine1518-N6/adenine1519-N6)-dimethyltransferase
VKLGIVDTERFLEFVKICFAQKRKTLLNNLRSLGKTNEARAALERCGLRADVRAEQLTVPEFAKLAREIGMGSGV